ncbi:MAG: hypothetical protein KF773_35620 [Deltaproteobacteria bacterium]|nr:hypothetical protein [Deltaproteobacteria bacterium]
MQTLVRVQRGLEALYRVDTGVVIDEFVVGAELRDLLAPVRRPREQLLVCEERGEMSLALFIDPAALANLAAHDPGARLDDRNLGDFLLAVEGVSHFIYAIVCARADRPLTQLELELQAEVDKYVTCLLACGAELATSATLRHRLFAACEYEADLDHDEHARYRAANDNAHRYAAWLERTFIGTRRIPEMLGELRRFYRIGLPAKLATIARAA